MKWKIQETVRRLDTILDESYAADSFGWVHCGWYNMEGGVSKKRVNKKKKNFSGDCVDSLELIW